MQRVAVIGVVLTVCVSAGCQLRRAAVDLAPFREIQFDDQSFPVADPALTRGGSDANPVLLVARVGPPAISAGSASNGSAIGGAYSNPTTRHDDVRIEPEGATWRQDELLKSRLQGVDVMRISEQLHESAAITPRSLLQAASGIDAKWLLVFTVRTTYGVSEGSFWLLPITIVTVGLSPTLGADADCYIDALLFDLRSRSIKCEFSLHDDGWQPAAAMTIKNAYKQVSDRTETRVLRRLLDEVAACIKDEVPSRPLPPGEQVEAWKNQ